MARMGVYDQIKSAFQDLIAPEIHALRGEIAVINEKITALDAKIDGVEARLMEKIDNGDARLAQTIDNLDSRLTQRIESLDTRLTEKIDNGDARLNIKIDSLRGEMVSMKNELIAEIRTVDVRVEGVAREIQVAMDIRERLVALEARRQP